MAVVGSIGRKRFGTVLAFEGLLPGVLPDMCAEYTRGSELLCTIHPVLESVSGVDSHVFV